MLNITPATAEAATAQTADAYASQAATRPLAGFGAGAFTCDGAWVGSLVSEMAAVLALPRIKPAIGATSARGAQAVAGAAFGISLVDSGGASIAQVSTGRPGSASSDNAHTGDVPAGTHNFIQMTRQYPVTPGGVGPHQAREPVPV
jgi:hypothetical protein